MSQAEGLARASRRIYLMLGLVVRDAPATDVTGAARASANEGHPTREEEAPIHQPFPQPYAEAVVREAAWTLTRARDA